MQDLEEVCNVTLVSDDSDVIRAHKVILASVSTLSGHLPDWWQEYMFWIDLYERSVF